MKFFIGTSDISSQIEAISQGLKSLGHETLTGSAQVRRLQQSKLDYNFSEMPYRYFKWLLLPNLRKRVYKKYGPPRERVLQKALKECDVFIFVTHPFRMDFSDLALIREAGKKIIFLFTGSDIRWKYAMEQDFAKHKVQSFSYPNYNDSIENFKTKIFRLRTVEKYAHHIISVPNQSQMALRPYHLFRQFVSSSKFTPNPQQRKEPVVIHAASSEVKGSPIIVKVLKELKEEGLAFDYKILSGLPFHEIKSEYENCDVLVGQMHFPSGGFQERELLACGKVVLSSMLLHYPDHQLKDSPIIDVNPDTLKETLRALIPDVEKRQALAEAARPYQEKHHSPEAFAQNLLDILNGQGKDEIAIPTF